ncbi:MAG: carboxymuconolactone decarboxylase family protein [Microthrixaceae bacterium]
MPFAEISNTGIWVSALMAFKSVRTVCDGESRVRLPTQIGHRLLGAVSSLGDMQDLPRLEPITAAEWDEETAEVLGAMGDLNIFHTLAHHPKLLKRWLVFGNHVLAKSTLPERERELVILRTGWRCGSEYEFGQHTVIGARCGLTEAQIRRLATEELAGWSDDDAVLVTATDELVEDHTLSDESWQALNERWSTQQVLDLIFAVGQYTLVSTALRSLGVQLDEGTPGWPT